MDAYEFEQQIFLELLRAYHNGVGITHPATDVDGLVLNLRRESKAILKRYQQCEHCMPEPPKEQDDD